MENESNKYSRVDGVVIYRSERSERLFPRKKPLHHKMYGGEGHQILYASRDVVSYQHHSSDSFILFLLFLSSCCVK